MGGTGALEGGNDFILGFRQRPMQAVAVGGFDQQQVGLRHHFFRVVQDGALGHAEIPRENQLARPAVIVDRHFQPG